MTLTLLIYATTCVLGTERYSIIEYETLQNFPLVTISELRDDLRSAGTISEGTWGPQRAATWRAGALELEVSTWAQSRGEALEGNEALWGLADLATYTRAFRIDFGGTITGTWSVPSDPAFTHLVGAIDGDAVVCNSAGSGSADWTARHCKEDGSVVTITGSTGSMYPEAVGRLSDGSPVAAGGMYVGSDYHAFLWYFDDGQPAIDLHDQLNLDVSSFVKAIDAAGKLHVMTRDASYQWSVVVHDPVTGEVTNGIEIPFVSGLFINSGSGAVSGAGTKAGEQVAWRSVLGEQLETVTMPDSVLGVLGARVDTSGAVLVTALVLEPVYQSEVVLWPAGANELISLQDRTIGTLPDGDVSVLTTSPGGHAALGTQEGLKLLMKLSPGDVDGDGSVDVNDLLSLLEAWGPWDGPCGPDLTFDGYVDVDDVLLLLAEWAV